VVITSALIAHVAWHWMIERGSNWRISAPKIDANFSPAHARAHAMLILALAVCSPTLVQTLDRDRQSSRPPASAPPSRRANALFSSSDEESRLAAMARDALEPGA